MPQALPYGTTAAAFGLRAAVAPGAVERFEALVDAGMAEFENEPTGSDLRAFDVGEAPAPRAMRAFYSDSDDEIDGALDMLGRASSQIADDDDAVGEWSAEASASSLLLEAPSWEDVEMEHTLDEPAPESGKLAGDAPSGSALISLSELRQVSQPAQPQLELRVPSAPEPVEARVIQTERLARALAPAKVPHTRGMRIAAVILVILELIVLIAALVLWLVR
jgi:hypothetical protein